MELSKEELNNISGGIALRYKYYIVGGILTFFAGLLDGFLRPLRCY